MDGDAAWRLQRNCSRAGVDSGLAGVRPETSVPGIAFGADEFADVKPGALRAMVHEDAVFADQAGSWPALRIVMPFAPALISTAQPWVRLNRSRSFFGMTSRPAPSMVVFMPEWYLYGAVNQSSVAPADIAGTLRRWVRSSALHSAALAGLHPDIRNACSSSEPASCAAAIASNANTNDSRLQTKIIPICSLPD